ncbi:lipopolysaccharide kinase InaA family protein [Wenyingzhuangia sp. IMCC45533]
MHCTISFKFDEYRKELNHIIHNFDTFGKNYGNQNRNSLKLFDLDGDVINVKSFKVPNLINQLVYRFVRKSKAQRSYEYANKLTKLDIGTPEPIAFFEFKSIFFLKKSYYISQHLNYDLTYRELTTNLDYPNHEAILRAFTRFTFNLHQKGIHFLDHSPGNTLIKKNLNNVYDFYLVDLNRMEFKELDFETRMKNFARLTKEQSLIKIMANEYAIVSGNDENVIYTTMNNYVTEFQNQFKRKKEMKRKLKFWKNN